MRPICALVVLLAGCDGPAPPEVDAVDLLFFSRAPGGNNEVRGLQLDAPSASIVIDDLAGATAAMFLDADRVVATVGEELVITSLASGRLSAVTADVVLVGPDGVGETVVAAGFIDTGEPELDEEGEPIAAPLDFDLYRVEAATGATTQLTEGPSLDSAPTVADDGRVFYVSDASGQNELWALDGATPRQLTENAGVVGRATVTRDGSALVWGQATADGPILVTMSTAGGSVTRVGPGVIGSSPAIAPDGRLVFSRFEAFAEDQDPVAELFVFDPATETTTQLTDDGRIASAPALAR